MELPAHVQKELKLGSTVTDDELTTAADGWPLTGAAFGLTGAEFAAAVLALRTNQVTITVSTPSRVNQNSWMYLELSNQGVAEGWILTTPKLSSQLPPTAASKALVGAWFTNPAVINDQGIAPGLLLRGSTPTGRLTVFLSRLAPEW